MPVGAWIDRLRRRSAARTRRKVRERNEFVRLGLARLEDRVVLDGAVAAMAMQPGQAVPAPSDLAQFSGAQELTIESAGLAGHSATQEVDLPDQKGAVLSRSAPPENSLATAATATEGELSELAVSQLSVATATADQDVIDFESGFSDLEPVASVATPTNVVTFGVGDSTPQHPPYIAAVGGVVTAFNPADTPADGLGGSFVLTDENVELAPLHSNFFLQFDKPIVELSLDLFDFRGDGGPDFDTVTLTGYSDASFQNAVVSDTFLMFGGFETDGNLVQLRVQTNLNAIQSATLSFLHGDDGVAIDNISFTTLRSLHVLGPNLVFTDIAGNEDNRLVVSSDGIHLTIRDENGHPIDFLTSLPGAFGGGNEVSIPLASLAGVTGLVLNTRGGNDSVTLDLSSNANSILAQFATVTYDGGSNTGPGDKLRFVGDGVTKSVYTPDAATAGSGVVIVSSPSESLLFSFHALEPVDFTGMAEAKLVTPATVTGADVLTVAAGSDSLNGLVAALVVSGTVGGTAIETGHFFGNQSVVIVTGSGPDGNDSIGVVGAANAHGNSNLSIDTGPLGQDSVQVSGNVTLAGHLNINTASLSIQSIVSLGGPALIATRGDAIFSAAGQLHASQVTIAAAGAITLANGALINAGAGTIALSAVGNITLGRLVTTNATSTAVSIVSLTGSIVDGGDSGGPNIVAEGLGAVVSISAAQTVGSVASPLDLAVRHLVVTSGGDQSLRELDNLSSLNLTAGSSTIHLSAGGQIQDADADLDISAGKLNFVGATAGTVAQPIQTQLDSLIANVVSGDLHLVESNGLTVISASAPEGSFSLRTLAGNLTIELIEALGLVSLTASTGAILAGPGEIIVATSLELAAALGVGTAASPLFTQVARLEGSGGAGGVFVDNLGDLQVGGISPALLGLTGLSASGSDIVLAVTGNLTTVESITTTAGGAIDLSASGDLIVQAAITSQTGAIDLLAQRALRVAGTSITSTSGPITLIASPGAVPAAGSFSGITLTGATIGSTSGDITLQGQGGAGGGHGLLLTGSSVGQTGSSDVILAGKGTAGLADIAWDTLTLAKSGGTFTFQDTVQGNQLLVLPGPYRLLLMDGGVITQAVNFQNTGGVVLGNQDSDVLTFTGGLTSIAGPTTLHGTIATAGTNITLGSTALAGTVTLATGGGDVSMGPIQGAGVPLTINAGTGDVSLADPSNAIGDLTITADELFLAESDNITQGGAWKTTGATVLSSGPVAIVLTNPANQFGPLSLTGGNITVVESGDTQLSAVTWSGLLNIDSSGNLLVSGPISGSGVAQLAADGNVTFAPTGSLVSPSAVNVAVTAGVAIALADGSLINAGAGTIGLSAAANITLASLVSAGGNITLSAAGDILATSTGLLETATGTILLLADSNNSGGGTIQFAGNIDVGSGQVIFQFSDADGLLSGSIKGSGGLVKQGLGTLTIASTSINTYTGTTQLLAGTLRVDGAIGAAGAAGMFFLAGGTTLTGGGDVNAPIFSSATSARIVSLGDLSLGDNSTDGFDFAGSLLVSSGDNVTLRDADLARLGILTSIAGGGRLTAQGGVEVGSGERLAGSGSVSGNVVVLAGGTVTPGASPGIVSTAQGNVVLFADAIYLVEVGGTVAGSQHDQINVQGTVNVSGAVLNLAGGLFKPPPGTIFTLIVNDDAGGIADPVIGQFRGLPEKATVRFGGIEATISYVGGTGNDVTLTVTDNLKIVRAPTPAPDVVAVVRNETGGGGAASFVQRAEAAPVVQFETARPVAVSQSSDARPQTLDTRTDERLRVFLMVVDELTGQEEGQPIDLDPRVIDDVLGFFQRYRFPNGRYRIYLQEAGKSPRLIIEISIEGGRAVSSEALSAPAESSAPKAQQPVPAATPAPPAPPDAAQEAPDNAAAPLVEPPGPAPADQSGSAELSNDAAPLAASAHRWSAAAASLSASLSLVAAAPNWRQRVRHLLAQQSKLPRTRFYRRVSPLPPQKFSPPT